MTDGGYTCEQIVAMHAERRRKHLLELANDITGCQKTLEQIADRLDKEFEKSARVLTDLHDIELSDLRDDANRRVKAERERILKLLRKSDWLPKHIVTAIENALDKADPT